MFDFRIIDTTDGNQVIDRHLKTPYNALSLSQMQEYIKMDAQLAIMDNLRKKQMKRYVQKQKVTRNFLYKLACLCRLI